MNIKFVLLTVLAFQFTPPAFAAVVNLCATDTQAAAGSATMNLDRAVALGGRITFDCGVGATIRITKLHQLVRDTEIDGGGIVTLNGGGARVFIGSSVKLSLRGLNITEARAEFTNSLHLPGAIVRGSVSVEVDNSVITKTLNAFDLPYGSMKIDGTTFNDNEGTVVNAPNLILRRSQFRNTRGRPIDLRGGQATIEDSVFSVNGPSTFLDCKLTIERSQFAAGVTTENGGALQIGCAAEIRSSEFVNNSANSGGAIWLSDHASNISLQDVKFRGNLANKSGGAIGFGIGGSIVLNLHHVIFMDNHADRGGAINLQDMLGGPRRLEGAAVLFVRNVATGDGGGIFGADVKVRLGSSVFLDNEARGEGGAFAIHPLGEQAVEISNSLIARNRAGNGGSAFAGNGAAFINTTISNNVGVAILPRQRGTPFTTTPRSDIRFVNSIIATNQGGNCGPMTSDVGYVSAGRNLQYPGSSCGSGVAEADPGLDTMYVPPFASPAFASGVNSICEAQPVANRDVYGQRRPRAAACSIGAVEGEIEQRFSTRRRKER